MQSAAQFLWAFDLSSLDAEPAEVYKQDDSAGNASQLAAQISSSAPQLQTQRT